MSRPTNLSFIGRSNTDYLVSNAVVHYGDQSITMELAGASITIGTHQLPLRGGKVSAYIPEHALLFANAIRQGGGALNSASAYRLISELPCRYLDACSPDDSLTLAMAKLRLSPQYLELYPRPRNLVVGSADDRIILKPPSTAVASLTTRHSESIAWACQALIVAANSVGDPSVIRQVVRASAHSGARLFAMVTPAPPSGLIVNEVIPASAAVFAAWDEIPRLLGPGFRATRAGAVSALRHMRALAPGATMFITLGANGVLTAGPGANAIHLALRPRQSAAVQAWIANDPSRTCGCGDAFFAGAAAWYSEGASLVTGLERVDGEVIQAAISGCAAAIRWTGYQTQLTAGDFIIVNPVDANPAEFPAEAA